MSPASLHMLRRSCQSGIFLLFAALPWLNAAGLHLMTGSLFALDFFGIPFADPASAVQAMVLGVAAGISPGWRLVAGGGLALLLALLLGRVFCGWLCPYGLLSELAHRLSRGSRGSAARTGRERQFFASKAGIFILALVVCAVSGYSLLTLLSMPGELSLVPMRLWQGLTAMRVAEQPVASGSLLAVTGLGLLVPAVALLAEILFGKRVWCRYICPQSVMLGLAAWLLPKNWPGLRVGWNPASCTCKGEVPCRAACSLGCEPRHKAGPSRRDCIMCGDCVKACSRRGGALHWQWRV